MRPLLLTGFMGLLVLLAGCRKATAPPEPMAAVFKPYRFDDALQLSAAVSETQASSSAFMADPDWLAARAETEKNGPLVERVENMLLAPTAYSTVK